MDNRFRSYLAELIGAFLVVYVGAGVVCAFHLPDPWRPDVTGVALGEGLILAVVLSATTLVSEGCCNPAVTLTLYVFKRFERGHTLLLIVVQLIGAVLGGLALRLTFGDRVLIDARLGTPHLGAALLDHGRTTLSGCVAGVCLEAVFTAVLTLAVFVSLLDKRGPKLGGVLIGMAQVVAVLFGFYLTGGAANPARWFGTVIWQATVEPSIRWDDHMVYWAGPILGAMAAGLVYTTVIGLPKTATTERPK
jgi:glycerol uptake facilitator-like aquaporin